VGDRVRNMDFDFSRFLVAPPARLQISARLRRQDSENPVVPVCVQHRIRAFGGSFRRGRLHANDGMANARGEGGEAFWVSLSSAFAHSVSALCARAWRMDGLPCARWSAQESTWYITSVYRDY